MQIGTQLRQIRQTRKLTLAEVGAATDLSISYLSKIERCLTEPRIDELNKLSRHYDVSLSHFLEDEQSKRHVSHRSSFTSFLAQMNGRVDSAMQDLLLRVDAQAHKPAQTVDEWLRYYYVISAVTSEK